VPCLSKSIVAWLWLLALPSQPFALSAAEVEVRLTNGRMLRGAVNEDQTSKEQLVLEVRSSGIAMRRSLPWREIAATKLIARPSQNSRPEQHATGDQGVLASTVSIDEYARDLNFSELPLSELIVAAQPVSTFGRMDWDSLRLSLRGFDQTGTPVPLFGTLQVTLWGVREHVGRPIRVNTPTGYVDVSSQRHQELDRIHTWTRSLDSFVQRLPGIGTPIGGRSGGGIVYEDLTAHPWSASGFGSQSVPGFQGRQDRGRPIYARNPSDVVQVILPLPQRLPDSDAQRWPIGEVTVELLMPGVGVFSSAAPAVVLVHQSPLRQELLNQSGSRFFPDEVTTDSRGFWREPGHPLQLRQITAPFPTAIGNNPLPVKVIP
jgi:hypothetical protein